MTNAESLVREYLAAMERRDLPAARAMLAPEFEMTFPGDRKFSTLEQLVEFGATRYQSVGKRYERFDTVKDGASSIVYCFGTLHGRWLDGTSFTDVRFIDRFAISEDKFTQQLVWNDLGEVLHEQP